MRRPLRSALALAATAAVVITGLAATPAAATPSTNLVISQVYGGGGNAGATYTNDFIEIFNRGSSAASTSGWSVQYASSSGTGNFVATALPVATVPAGGYLLVKEASSGSAGAALPGAEGTGSLNLSAVAGKVALVDQVSSLACNGGSTPCSSTQLAHIIDLVGYGAGTNFYEGTGPAPSASNTTSGQRNDGGCTDTDNNSADVIAAAPTPRNSATAAHVCGVPTDTPPTVTSVSPSDGATGVDPATNLTVIFSEPVNPSGAWLTLSCPGVDAVLSVSGDGTTFTGDPVGDLPAGVTCTATVHASDVTDLDGTPDHPAADKTWSFTTAVPVQQVAIHDIQGAAHRSPLAGQTVGTTGIVTAVKPTSTSANGFWLQDPNPDADPATSEGVFVFTSRTVPTVAVGDSAHVTGAVQEFRPSSATGPNLTVTELSASAAGAVSQLSTGNPLPAATVVGDGGRIPPDQVIEDDATGDVESSGVFDPGTDGLDFWESLEGMRIQLNDAVAVGPTATSFGETPVVGDNGAHASVRSARGGVVISADDFNPERITVADDLTPMPSLNVGDHYSGPLVGVEDYNFGLFMLQVTDPVTRVDGGLTRESTSDGAADQLTAATFNVENLDPKDGAAKFDRLAHIVVDNMRAPDLISVEEVQDNNGNTNDGTVDASVTMATLIQAIKNAGGPTYAYREIDPVNNQDGGEPGGNIRVVLMFRTDVGLAFVDRGAGSSTVGTAVVDGANGPELTDSPGRIDPTDTAWSTSRKPLVGEFTFRGRHLFAIGNHFNSKGGDDPLLGRYQPPTRSSEVQRHKQATIVHDFVSQILAKDANADIVVMGDLNDFEFSDTVSILKGSSLHDLVETLPKAERYSYDFEGNSQVLDHVLVSDHLFAAPNDVDVVHVNSEFFDQASDHDPTVVRLTMEAAPTVDAGGPYSVDEGGSVTLSATGSDADGDGVTYTWDLNNDGQFGDATGPSPTFSAAAIDGPATQTVTVRASDGFETTTASTTVEVANVAPTIDSASGAHAACGQASSLTVAWHDPAPEDSSTVVITWGDGSTSTVDAGKARQVTATHSYAEPGTYQVGVEVSDDDGGTSSTTTTLALDYSTAGLMSPWSNGSLTVNAGSKVPIKAFVAACDGSHPSDLGLTYEVRSASGGPALATGTLRWDGEKYVGQLDSSVLPGRGTYVVTVTVPSTGQTFGGTLRLR